MVVITTFFFIGNFLFIKNIKEVGICPLKKYLYKYAFLENYKFLFLIFGW